MSSLSLDLLGGDDYPLLCGVDEAGRGPLAGPVYAAAVVLDPHDPIDGLDDSKKLSDAQRQALGVQIRSRSLAYAVVAASVAEIDRLNILEATMQAMHRAVQALGLTPDLVKVDGNRLPRWPYRSEPVIGGDALVPAISAASILAKNAQIAWMQTLHQQHPAFGFDRHAGYGTAVHLRALNDLGPTNAHRQSFAPVRSALQARGQILAASTETPGVDVGGTYNPVAKTHGSRQTRGLR